MSITARMLSLTGSEGREAEPPSGPFGLNLTEPPDAPRLLGGVAGERGWPRPLCRFAWGSFWAGPVL